jgi:mono/diheme cytochrome c family protein
LKSWLKIAVAAAVLAFGACATAIPHLSQQQVTLAQQKWPGVEAESLEHGRSLYVTRCAACHEAPRPADLEATALIGEMAERAHLSAEEQQLVMQFVEASRLAQHPAIAVTPAPATAPTAAAAAN